jgi:hypothetical protein
METLIQFLDDVEDAIITTTICLRRSLSWQPRERRQAPRLREDAAKPLATSARQ